MLPERLICVMTCYFLPADVVKLHRPSVPARRSSDLSAIATGLPLPFSAPPPPPGPWPLLISSGHGPGGGGGALKGKGKPVAIAERSEERRAGTEGRCNLTTSAGRK